MVEQVKPKAVDVSIDPMDLLDDPLKIVKTALKLDEEGYLVSVMNSPSQKSIILKGYLAGPDEEFSKKSQRERILREAQSMR